MSDPAQIQAQDTPRVERRAHNRRRVEGLIYVGLGEDNGGIVLNLGEDGLGFHAAVPLQQNHFPHVRFQLPVSGKWVELSGDVAWTDESRTSAGMKFIGLPDEARAEIRDWVAGRTSAPETPRWGTKQEELPPRATEAWPQPTPVFARVAETLGPEIGAPKKERIQETVEAAVVETQVAETQVAETQAAPAPVVESRPVESSAAEERSASAEPEAPAATDQPPSAEEQQEEIVAAAMAANETASEARTLPPSSGRDFAAGSSAPASATLGGSYEWERRRAAPPAKKRSPWALAGIFLVVAAASFAAGLAVGRGSLRPWIHALGIIPAENVQPAARTTPQAPGQATARTPTPTQGASKLSSGVGTGPNPAQPANGKVAGTAAAPLPAPPPIVVTTPGSGSPSQAVEFPEEPISASSTVAMSATRSVEVPAAANGESRPGSAHVVPGELIWHVEPDYPVETIQEQIEGAVKLRVTIAKDGKVKQIEPMGGPPALVGTSVAAVQQWRYKPTLVNGKPIEVQEVVKIVFRLPLSSAPPANP